METKDNTQIEISDIELIISKFIFQVINENIPYTWFGTEEPFYNQYIDTISYDYSGDVEIMTEKNLKEIKNESYLLEDFLSAIYINQWTPTYTSNYGKAWTNYKDLLEQYFDEWKYDNFDLYDDDGNELNEDLENDLNDIFYEFLQKDVFDIYYKKILNDIRSSK